MHKATKVVLAVCLSMASLGLAWVLAAHAGLAISQLGPRGTTALTTTCLLVAVVCLIVVALRRDRDLS